MNLWKVLFIAVFSAAMIFSAACQKQAEQPGGGQTPASKSEVEAATARLDTLFNEGKALDYANEYASDAVSVRGSGRTLAGRNGINMDLENLLKTVEAKRESKSDEILMGPDFSVEKGTYTLNSTQKSGKMTYFESGKYVICRKQIDGKWQISWDMWISDQKPADEPPSKDKDDKKEDKK